MTDPISDATLDELLRLEAEATPGPWSFAPHPRPTGVETYLIQEHFEDDPEFISVWQELQSGNARSTTALIVALRNHAPALLLELRELRAEVEARRECVELRAKLARLEGES